MCKYISKSYKQILTKFYGKVVNRLDFGSNPNYFIDQDFGPTTLDLNHDQANMKHDNPPDIQTVAGSYFVGDECDLSRDRPIVNYSAQTVVRRRHSTSSCLLFIGVLSCMGLHNKASVVQVYAEH